MRVSGGSGFTCDWAPPKEFRNSTTTAPTRSTAATLPPPPLTLNCPPGAAGETGWPKKNPTRAFDPDADATSVPDVVVVVAPPLAA